MSEQYNKVHKKACKLLFVHLSCVAVVAVCSEYMLTRERDGTTVTTVETVRICNKNIVHNSHTHTHTYSVTIVIRRVFHFVSILLVFCCTIFAFFFIENYRAHSYWNRSLISVSKPVK